MRSPTFEVNHLPIFTNLIDKRWYFISIWISIIVGKLNIFLSIYWFSQFLLYFPSTFWCHAFYNSMSFSQVPILLPVLYLTSVFYLSSCKCHSLWQRWENTMKDSEEVIKHNELLHSLGRPMTFEIRVFFKFLSSSLVLIATCICHRANLMKNLC